MSPIPLPVLSTPGARRRHLPDLVRKPEVSFFICQPHASEGVVHRGDGALQMAGGGDFRQRCAGMGLDVGAHPFLLFFGKQPFASDTEVQVVDNAELLALSQQLLDEGKGDFEALGNLPLGAVVPVTSVQDADSQVEGDGVAFHGAGVCHNLARMPILFLESL